MFTVCAVCDKLPLHIIFQERKKERRALKIMLNFVSSERIEVQTLLLSSIYRESNKFDTSQ